MSLIEELHMGDKEMFSLGFSLCNENSPPTPKEKKTDISKSCLYSFNYKY